METVRVLLADDHAIVRAGIRKVVDEIPGLEVVSEVGDGPSLFSAIHALQPDFVLVDITMPEFDAITDIRKLRGQYPEMKFLVVSAYDDHVYVQGLFGAGVNGYHLKDQPLHELKLAIERILSGERWISSSLIPKLVDYHKPLSSASMLTPRQRDILRLLREGSDNNAIAKKMDLSVKTVENHLTRIYRQLNVQSRLEAVKFLNQNPEILGVKGQEAVQSPVESLHPKGPTVLLVDDNPRYLRQMQRVMGKVWPSATLYEAEETNGAVFMAQRVNPRLVLLDVVLGEEDGISCARKIHAVSPQSRIVMISAYPDREFHRLSLEAGAVAFLDKKDLDVATLRQVIDDVIS